MAHHHLLLLHHWLAAVCVCVQVATLLLGAWW
jgi:hypothetical protein